MPSILFVCILIFISLISFDQGAYAQLSEELHIDLATPNRRQALARFVFQASSPLHVSHTSTFPRPLLDLVATHNVTHLSFSLTRGHVQQLESGSLRNWAPKPPGLELQLQFSSNGNEIDTRRMGRLVQALGGITGAAVPAGLAHGVIVNPTISWLGDDPVQGPQVYIALPHEGLGATSLSAFLTLLPCRQAAGLGSLLAHRQFLSSPYHSLGITSKVVGSKVDVTLSASMVVVVDKPLASAPSLGVLLSEVFGGQQGGPSAPCDASTSSAVYVQGGPGMKILDGCEQEGTGLQVCALNPSSTKAAAADKGFLKVGPQLLVSSHIAVTKPQQLAFNMNIQVDNSIEANTSLSTGEESSVLLHISQPVPWEIDVLWHTFTLSINSKAVSLKDPLQGLEWYTLAPATIRGNAAHIELLIKLEGGSLHHTVDISINMNRRLITVFDYPPDVSRGIDVPAAHVVAVPSTCSMHSTGDIQQQQAHSACKLSHARTPVHVVSLPIPDASMPFNVICFTSTIMAMFFGSAVTPALIGPQEMLVQRDFKVGLKNRLRRAVLAMLVVGGGALYLDPSLQRQAQEWLAHIGL